MIRESSVEGEREQGRVPDCDVVEVGRLSSRSPTEPLDLEFARLRSIRQEMRAGGDHSRDTTRRLTALLIIGLGLVGALYVGKRYTDAHVIVVPTTANERSVIT